MLWQRDLELAYDKGVAKGLAIREWMKEHEEHLIRAGYAAAGAIGGGLIVFLIMRRPNG